MNVEKPEDCIQENQKLFEDTLNIVESSVFFSVYFKYNLG